MSCHMSLGAQQISVCDTTYTTYGTSKMKKAPLGGVMGGRVDLRGLSGRIRKYEKTSRMKPFYIGGFWVYIKTTKVKSLFS